MATNPTGSTEELSINALERALAKFDWTAVKKLIDAAGGPAAALPGVLESLRRSKEIVFEFPNPTLVAERDAVLNKLQTYFTSSIEVDAVPQALVDIIQTVHIADDGFRRLRDALKETQGPLLGSTMHIAAALELAETDCLKLYRALELQIQNAPNKVIQLRPPYIDESGDIINTEAVTEGYLSFVSMTLLMEAYKNKWFDVNGRVVIPPLPTVTDDAISKVRGNVEIATYWRRWRVVQRRVRALGRRLRVLSSEECAQHAMNWSSTIVVEEGCIDSDITHLIAHERVSDRLAANFFDLGRELKDRWQTTVKVEGSFQYILPPRNWISLQEIHGLHGLQQYLGYDVINDTEAPGGLKIVEWVRGYSALMALVASRPDLHTRTRSGWLHFFAKFGLPASAAEQFLENLTFRKDSHDLFDHPLIRLSNGQLRLVTLAVRSTNIPIVVLSAIGQLNVQLKKKGKAFESMVIERLKEAGLSPYAFTANKGNDEYQYDAVLPWGDYLFVFECKNRALPFGSPIQDHYFNLVTKDNLKQIKRLMKGFDECPDIFAKHLPPGCATKTRVPVVLNCFPYAELGARDGVYFYDFAALSRFFSSGEINVTTASKDARTPIEGTGWRIWKGDIARPEDLLKQLKEPLQVKVVEESLMPDLEGFPLGPDVWFFGKDIFRGPMPGFDELVNKLTLNKADSDASANPV